jgi:type II secretory pathway predicted ATPase ExeA
VEHLQHFGLARDPFQIEPDLRFYYDSALHSSAQRRVERSLRQSKGLSILSGECGTGKSLLARRLLGELEEEVFEAALMVMLPGVADRRTVVTRFAKHLEVEDVSDDPSGGLGQVYEQLAVVREDGRHTVLILDDSHLLGPEALAEVGALLNLEYEDRRLVSILLVGPPELDIAVASDRSLGQRVDLRVRLAALDLDSTKAYLANRIQVVGGDPSIISEEAIGMLFKQAGGRPRLINTLADNALFEAYLAGRSYIDANDVEQAAGDLGIGLGLVAPQVAFAARQPNSAAPRDLDSELSSPPTGTPGASGAALDLDAVVGAGGPEMGSKSAPGEAEATRLMLNDELEAAVGDEPPAIELGEPIGSDDGLSFSQDGASDLAGGEEIPDLVFGEAADATRLVVPADERSQAPGGSEGGGEGEEIEALFGEILED